MQPKTDIHELLKSMSMSEKRYFHRFSSLHTVGETNNYQRLFNAIAAQDVYDETAIKRKFSNETFIRHLPSEKNYLYQQVLDALNSFNRNRTLLARHCARIATIEMLFQRGLFRQCGAQVQKLKKEAYLLEKFSLLMIILRWETLLHIQNEDDKALNRSLWEEMRILEVMKVQTILTQIAFNIQIAIDKGEADAKFIKRSEKELKANLPANLQVSSFWTKYYYHSSIGLLSSLKNDQKKRLSSFIEIKKIMDDSPQFIRDLPGIYHTNMNNMVNVLFLLGRFDEAAEYIRQQKNFFTTHQIRNLNLSRIVLMNTLESELFLLYKTKKIKDGQALIRKMESELKKLDMRSSPMLYDAFYMMAVIELRAKSYKAAGKWLNRILNLEREVHLRKELPINARLLYLLVMYESHDVLFDTRLRSARRYILQEKAFPTHMKIIEVIRLLADGSSSGRKRNTLRKYVSEIRREMKQTNAEALNKQFDFAEWIDEAIADKVLI